MRLPVPGQMFERKYKLQEVLGRGGFAAVFRATDIEVGRDVAIKILAPSDEGYADDTVSRFMREARVLGGFQDPHTITMFEFGRSDGLLYMVFEYVRGQDLANAISERGAFEPEVVVHILKQVLQSLSEAHAAGVLHRDVKPANILIHDYMGDPNRVKLLDFGLAKPTAVDQGGNITRDGSVVGTPRYMAPEQLCDGDLTPASDLYSLGLVAHEMLVARPAIEGRDAKEVIAAQLSDVPLRVPRNDRASAALRLVVDRMTSRSPAARYQSTSEVLEVLAAHEQVETAPLPPVPDEPKGEAPQPSTIEEPDDDISITTILIAGVGAALLAVGGLMALSALNGEAEVPKPPEFQLPPAAAPPHRLETAEPEASAIAETDIGVGETDVGKQQVVRSGCGEEPAWSGEKLLLWEDGLDRAVWLTYLPRRYDKNRKYPVVLMFHKATKDAKTFIDNTRFEKLADRHGFVIIAPDGAGATSPWDSDTPKFVRAALASTAELVCLDTSRVYAVGHGGGGHTARELPCSMPLSAVAVAGSGVGTNERVCRADPPVPLIHFQGKEDRYVPFDGGLSCTGGSFLSMEQVEELWKDRNHCRGGRKSYARKKTGACWSWRCDATFVSCQVDGGHDWPGAKREIFELPGCAVRAPTYPFEEEIWQFFRKKGRRLGAD